MKVVPLLVLCTIICEGGFADENEAKENDIGDDIRQNMVKFLEGKSKKDCRKAEDGKCPRDDVTFWLYTRETKDSPIKLNPVNPDHTVFVKGYPLIVLVHGYAMNKDKAINEVLRPAYFARGEYNVLSVDWSPLSQDHCYLEAARSVPTVGRCLTNFFSKLIQSSPRGMFSTVQILGHSMGAHVASYASIDMVNLPRLTLFDPAMPLFSDQDQLFRMGIAKTVDVWHSNIDLKGRSSRDGTVDLVFNDGMDQPGCNCNTQCSHLRAVQYYGNTLTGTGSLPAFPCDGGWEAYRDGKCNLPTAADLANFGEIFDKGKSGVYQAFTNPTPPFIIDSSRYLNENSFNDFKNTHDEKCKKHDILAFFVELFQW